MIQTSVIALNKYWLRYYSKHITLAKVFILILGPFCAMLLSLLPPHIIMIFFFLQNELQNVLLHQCSTERLHGSWNLTKKKESIPPCCNLLVINAVHVNQ